MKAEALRPWADLTLAPNGRPVAENFRAWFGNGALVDEAGLPRLVFHGTCKVFDAFDTGPQVSFGAHVGSRMHADVFTRVEGGLVLPLYANLRNPVRLNDCGDWDIEDVAHQLYAAGHIDFALMGDVIDWLEEPDSRWDPYEAVRRALEARGIDGVVYLNRSEGLDTEARGGFEREWSDERFRQTFPEAHDAWIVFRPQQLKSALGNRLFLPDSASLTDHDAALEMERSREEVPAWPRQRCAA